MVTLAKTLVVASRCGVNTVGLHLPVTSLNGIAIGDGSVVPIYSRLLAKWSDNVRVDICGQIQEWDKGGDDRGDLHGVTPYQFGSD